MVALAFGDDTAKRAGRLTLNPIKHIDPVGTLLVPAVLSLSGLGAYGWAKPVPVNPPTCAAPATTPCWCRWSGPLTNFVLAATLGCGLRRRIGGRRQPRITGTTPSLLEQIFFIAGFANIVLGIFNLIPCPPLDGAAVLERFLPARSCPSTTTSSRS